MNRTHWHGGGTPPRRLDLADGHTATGVFPLKESNQF